ncbi:Ficolin-1 [Holothuria leucospilota]|uniref:Ficolin-1 n=1 Tax=Holothuria leucospilota TaxID=206669 RepID=A0A9Q1CFI7_HOLLE|nr:Ficolin-1 [Holothuria leucospilota]
MVIYDNFRIGDEGSRFNLVSLGQYSGTADSFVQRCPGNVEYTQNTFIGEDQTCTVLPTDCSEIFQNGSTENGVYTILPNNWSGLPFKVYCNMENGRGWTVFQRRVNGSVNFYLDWEDYKEGFGFLDHEFWLGNDKIATLTNQRGYELRIDLINSLDTPYYATYSYFLITNEDDNYRLTLGSFGGNTGTDALDYARGYPFSTRDQDNDLIDGNCAQYWHGAWWYTYCHHSNLNGGYFESEYRGVWWNDLPGNEYNIQYTEMKIRPIK